MPDTVCGQCGHAVDDAAGIPIEARSPCSNCGSRKRLVRMTLEGKVETRSVLRLKGRRLGQKKPFVEQLIGASFFRKAGRWVRRAMLIDRRNDRYAETVTDTDGSIIHRTDEPLSKHRGHGSAKGKPRT